MLPPLILKRLPPLSPAGVAAVIIFIVAPFIALVYCFQHHRAIHFENPSLNICAHALLSIVPLILVWLMYTGPAKYESLEGEAILGRWGYFSSVSCIIPS